MTEPLPEALARSPWADRLRAALRACASASAALLRVRGAPLSAREGAGGQLKTGVDQAAEGWVLGLLRGEFPSDAFLSEEAFEESDGRWDSPAAYWTVDALDGTRSFADGFDGFCVQVAYVVDGVPCMGVVHEPVGDAAYLAVRGAGAYRLADGRYRPLHLAPLPRWDGAPVFVDSTVPRGGAGEVFRALSGAFLECGSVGLKVCRVADGSADVFLKDFTFKLWDVAPGEVVLREAGGRLGLWTGEPVRYDTGQVRWTGILAAPAALFAPVAAAVAQAGAEPVRAHPRTPEPHA